jgi:Tol biopolymer transport system component/tRNA A-37 threonylcarbamoyl transferase component Bud32
MTPERWREIERLYHAALAREPGERAAFLSGACGADHALRREVESLFDYRVRAESFMEQPAVPDSLASAVRRLAPSFVPGRLVGRTIGSYEVQALIGAGGMGEVYRAVDTRLNRTVAIKTLPEHLANDPERRARLQREARIVSSLNHPHICTLHDVGVQDDIHYLVMEHIDGETLEKRLERGPLPLARALEYAIQIVDALDKAHRRGVIHRDLKPGNVMLTQSGVKLLDFGLAMRSAPSAAIALDDTAHDGSKGLTAEGAIMGTLQYISPEQLEGRQPDARTDIFAFGALAYEMITGRTAFRASNQAQLVGAILKDDPAPIVDTVPQVSPRLAQTLARSLAKDPDERWQSANDLLFELRSFVHPLDAIGAGESRRHGAPGWIERMAWTSAIVACLAVAFLWARSRDVRLADPNAGTPPIRYTLVPAEGTTLYSGYGLPFALSPDGRQIVYASARADGTEQLWLRSLYSQLEQPMPGTEGANTPFWSPDSQWIGFFAANSLKKVRVSTGLTQVVATNVQTKGGAAWNANEVIVFATGPSGLWRVSAQGGPVSPATTPTEGSHFWPQFLGDGNHFIYAAAVTNSISLGSLGLDTPRVLMTFPVRISSLAYVPGYVLFVQDSTLFARPFDEQRLEFSADAIKVVDDVPVAGTGRAPFSVSAAGVLAYWPHPVGTLSALHWFDRSGRASVAVGTPAQYVGFALSPDSRQLAFSRAGKSGGSDVWVRDLTSGGENRLTFDGAAFTPQWSPDGSRIVFSGPGEKPPLKLFVRSVASAGAAMRIGVSRSPNFASSWSGDGGSIVSVRIDPATRNDLWIHRLEDGADERLSFNSGFNESHGKVSADNRWIAYDTDASGKSEVWVASFPSGDIRRQVSVGGGTSPEWGEGSAEVIYLAEDKRLMAVRFQGSPASIDAGTPRTLFRLENLAEVDRFSFATSNAYVATSNGERFLVAVNAPDPAAPPINIVVNWRALLRR